MDAKFSVAGSLEELARLDGNWQVGPVSLETAEAAYPLIHEAYKSIGLPIQNALALRDFDYALTLRAEEDGALLGVATFKRTPHGAKLGLVASNGSKEGRTQVKKLIQNLSNVNGVFAELSLKPAEIAYFEDQAVTTPYLVVQKVLAPKNIRRPSEGEFIENFNTKHMIFRPDILWNSYVRDIEINGVKTPVMKVMIGQPIMPQ